MGPSYLRVAAGACLVATGLCAASGAVAVAAPNSDSGSSHSSGANRSTGKASVGAARHRGPAARTGNSNNAFNSANGTDNTNSTQGPVANAVANVPDSVGQAVSSVTSTARRLGQAAVDPRATAPVMLTPNTVASTALAPLTSIVENVADVLVGPKVAHSLANVANQVIDGVLTPNPNFGLNPAAATSNNTLPRTPSPLRNAPELQTLAQPAPIMPGRSLLTTESGPAPRVGALPGVITPQLLSSQLPVNASKPPATAPNGATAKPNWFSGIASQIAHGVREALRNVSVTELAIAALPGVVGLFFFFATGVGLGRRQAKFGFAMASSGAMRFAVRGPLGVVRNGSTVAVHNPKKAASGKSEGFMPADGRESRRRHLRLVDRAA